MEAQNNRISMDGKGPWRDNEFIELRWYLFRWYQ